MARNTKSRDCGECIACCKPFSVSEVGKEGSGWCQHCGVGEGCDIYDSRPVACRQFICAWLYGMGDNNLRPDRFGVIVHVSRVVLGERDIPQADFFEVNEAALDRPDIAQMIKDNMAKGFVVVTHRILTADTYQNRVLMSGDHYTDDDVALFRVEMSQ